jgi:hypothetical protein
MTAFMTMRRTLLATMLGALCATGAAVAQEVSWSNPGPLGAGQRVALDLVFDETQPNSVVHLPAIDGLSVLGTPSQSSRVSIVNGRRSASVTLSYPVRADREGRVEIPAFDVHTADGAHTVPAMTLEVGPTMLSGKGRHGATPLNAAVSARMLPSNKQPYVGQVFDVDVVVALRDGRRGELVGTPEWKPQGIELEGWSKGQPASTTDGSAVRFRTRAVAAKPGPISVAPAQQNVRIDSGRERGIDDFFSMPDLADFFSRSDMSEVTVSTDPVELQVRALPQPAPAGFSGAVGDFKLESKIVPAQPQAGEPVTWTLTLKGTGNWADVQLPARAIPADIRALQPKQQRAFKENALFSGAVNEDLVLIPSRPGELQLEPVRFVYFNPQTEQYETAVAHPPMLSVAPSAVPVQQAAEAPQAAVASASGPHATEPASQAEATLPRDPLSGVGRTWSPLSGRRVGALSALPFGLLAAYWLFLAVRRARHTDPRRPQREAFAQLRAAIANARSAQDVDQRKAALLTWQHAAAIVLGLPVAAPTAAHVRAARLEGRLSDTVEQWFELWTASEQALYGRETRLAEWWYDQASALCARVRLPRLNPLRAFLPTNLLPFAVTSALLLVCVAAAHAAPPAAPLDEYRQGNFAAAQQQLAAQVAAAPSDWVARYNLGLAAAQLGDSGRAFGETAAAFVLQPRDEAVRWNLRVFATRVAGLDPVLVRVAFASGAAAIARSASPATWQAFLIAACVALCAGSALVLRQRYQGHRSVARILSGRGLLACGVIGIALALFALQQYGPLANLNAAIVAQATALRAVPTDAGSAQQPAPLASGTVVVTQKAFLGWVKVARANGETGWLRGSDLVPLYAAPSPV